MNQTSDLVERYVREIALPLPASVSGAERVLMLVYPPEQQRRVEARLDDLRVATETADWDWASLDLTHAFGSWVAEHEYVEEYLRDPRFLTEAALAEFEEAVVAQVRAFLPDCRNPGERWRSCRGSAACSPSALSAT